ncbi:tlde1 domain-containing protein [Mesorhizobium sp. 1B3]|uniref:DUF2778 domain-containing protein n=1 Tax=Mesorhizobium sp. 1B3 TaxID=3243599 RepID=UPI003D9597A2
MRPLLIAAFGTAFAGVAVWSAAGMVAMGSSFAPDSAPAQPELYFVKRTPALPADQHSGKAPRLLAAATARPVMAAVAAGGRGKSDRLPDTAERPDAGSNAARFDAVVKQAELTSEKLARLFDRAGSAKTHRSAAKASAPTPERFAPPAPNRSPTLLAYADPSPNGAGAALSALLTPPLEDEDLDPSEEADEALALPLPDFEATPSDAPLPQLRPRSDYTRRPAAEETGKPEARQAERPAEEDGPGKAGEREKPKRQKLAYARPDDPSNASGGLGRTLRNLFGGGARAGNGVAVYDISAARVYMPDGSVLEAHSGIGKMADDPRYVHVKMNGPTPPHTYNLRMREKRFHGVEAIRMLPVDGKNKHGRDGFLTHSYLLRGGRAESHGCVAFKNYDRFLNAFKQGKVKQLVVVPSGGRATMLASNGKSI